MTRWILALPLLFACHKASVGLPPAFDGERLPVTDLHKAFGKTFTIGGTTVSDVHRGWTSGTSAGFGPVEAERERRKWSFTIVEGGWSGVCGVNTATTDVGGRGPLGGSTTVTVASQAAVGCTFTPASGGAWNLSLNDVDRFDGWLSGDGRQVHIVPTSDIAGSNMHMAGITGWVALEGDRPVMVVDVLNQGAVWFAKDVPVEARPPLLAAAAALLLFEDPRES